MASINEIIEAICLKAEDLSGSTTELLYLFANLLEKCDEVVSSNWKDATCGQCAYWDKEGIVLAVPNKDAAFEVRYWYLPGCKNGSRKRRHRACPDYRPCAE